MKKQEDIAVIPFPGNPNEEETAVPEKLTPERWTMHFESVFSYDGSGAGIVLTSPIGDKLYYAVQLFFGRRAKVLIRLQRIYNF